MDKILILGISGFTGTHFQNYIKKRKLFNKYSFIGADKKNNCSAPISFRKIDLLDYEKLKKLIAGERPSFIINLAGTYNQDDLDLIIQINANISRYIFEIIIKEDVSVKKVLLIGSAAEYGHVSHFPISESNRSMPVNHYGLSKSVQTLYANYYFNNFHVNVNVARTFNIIGKNVSPTLSIGAFVNQIKTAKNGDSIYVGNINTKRDFLDIEDVIDAYWRILLHGRVGEIYNVCSGTSHYIKDILDFLIKESGKSLKIIVKDKYVKKHDINDSYGSNSKLIAATHWKQRIDIIHSIKRLYE